MENKENTIVLLAEEVTIDEKRSNDIFLLITFKLFDNRANRNREGVTAAFISEILNHRDKYAALPIYADVPKLLNRDYANLAHNYDPERKRFNTDQIGGLVDFTTSIDNDGVVSLYAEARIPKRDIDICERLGELYEMGRLNVSFEIKYNPINVIEKDGVRFVDAGEGNTLTGMAVVSVPAYPDATALDMVAETVEANEVNETVPDEVKIELAEEAQAAEAEAQENGGEVANAEVAEAETLHESVSVHESVNVCPETGDTIREVYTEHRVVEKVEDEPAPEEQEQDEPKEDPRDARIAELEAELARVKAELEKMLAAQAAAELVARQNEAKAFAEAQGLSAEEADVARAIAEVNYEAIAKMSMAKNSYTKEDSSDVAVAAFVNMEITGEYGGLLNRGTAK